MRVKNSLPARSERTLVCSPSMREEGKGERRRRCTQGERQREKRETQRDTHTQRRARERRVHTRVEKWDFCIWTNGNESTLNNGQVTRHVRFIVKNLLLLLLLCTDLFSSFYFWWGVGHWSLAGWVGRWQWVGSLGRGGRKKGFCFKSMLFNNGHLFMAKRYATSDFSGEILLLLSCFGGEGWGFSFWWGFPILGKWEREHVGYWPHVYIQMSRHVRFIVRNLLLSWVFFLFFLVFFFGGNYFTRQVC